MMLAIKPRALRRFKCRRCGDTVLATGGCGYTQCDPCKVRHGYGYRGSVARKDWHGGPAAMADVQAAIRDGALAHPTTMKCADCGKPAQEYDHRDYNKPLVVDPVCRRCNLRRGPAIPADGALQAMLARGQVPYRTGHRAAQLCRLMGRPDIAERVPKGRVTLADWLRFWPELGGQARPEPVLPVGAAERRELAERFGINEQYLWQCFTGRRHMAELDAVRIEHESGGAVRRWHVRVTDWHRCWPELVNAAGAPAIPSTKELA